MKTAMVQLRQGELQSEIFGEVNVGCLADGRVRATATIAWEPRNMEDGRIGIAIDGSASMQPGFGANVPLSEIFGAENHVRKVVRKMVEYLGSFDSTGRVRLAYWACGHQGQEVEQIGDCPLEDIDQAALNGPESHEWGRQTHLLPIVRYFVEDADFSAAKWAYVQIITDGRFRDLDAVKAYSWDFAQKIAKGERRFIKFVILGIGNEIDKEQMVDLDDMFDGSGLVDPYGNEIDLWDHKVTSDIKRLLDVFAEPFSDSENLAKMTHALGGKVLDDSGRMVEDYSDGVPYVMEFLLPPGSKAFVLEMGGKSFRQDLSSGLSRLQVQGSH